ncbi:MAG: DUF2752 domain-containing protein [Lachnospiraceae bacterium]
MKQYIRTVAGRLWKDIREYGMAVVLFMIYMVAVNVIFHAFCPVVIITGFPCPGCGLTRATGYLLTGRWQQAWEMNPVIYLIAVIAVDFVVNRYFLGRKVKGIQGLLILMAVVLCIVFCVRMYLYFPNRIPCVYSEDNVLARFFPFYQQVLHEWGIL